MGRLRFILTLLFAGAIVNILVALACALWTRPALKLITGSGRHPYVFKGFGFEEVHFSHTDWASEISGATDDGLVPLRSPRAQEAASLLGYRSQYEHNASVRYEYLKGAKPVRGAAVIEGEYPGTWVHGYLVRAGWPLRSFECELRFYTPTVPPTVACYRTSGAITAEGGVLGIEPNVCVPTQPLYRNFVCNSIFYAGLIWTLFLSRATIRRALRARRGLCATCGYDLRGTLNQYCPECGSTIRDSACGHVRPQ